MSKLKLMTIIGTRPEIIRLAAVIKRCDRYFDQILVHTGQNYDYTLNQVFFDDLGLRAPNYYLDAVGKDLGETIGNIIAKSYQLMVEVKPDAVLVLGDTNSCLSVIGAKRLHIPIFHMEAGNRCFDECLPEETNRRIVDVTADVNMCYSEHARRYLNAAGTPRERTYVVGSPMAEVLRRAVRFTAREDGAVEFAGVVDECGVTCDEKGLQLEVSGRGMAALLLDNEAESVSYQWATMEEILKNHVTPYGIVCTGYDAVTAAARYRVANGSSQWKALNDFAALHGGIALYFDKTGALEVKKNRKAARVSIDAKTPVTALSYCDKRYGVIAEALVVDSKAGVKQSVKNEAFCARGGTSRRVFYVPARSGTQAMRYTGEYQIAKSKEGAETLRVTIAGRFTAAPGDIAAVSGTKIGIVGNFRVIECVRRFGESGEACEVTMQRE